MTTEEINKFSHLTNDQKLNIVAQECGKLLIASMLDCGIQNFINCSLRDDKGNEYQLIFTKKPPTEMKFS